MKLSKNEHGSFNALLIPLILVVLMFFGALSFGMWAYSERTEYKDKSDLKAAAAVKVAEDKLSTEKDNEFLEREKKPYREYKSSAVFGNISFMYPKTWSGYIEDSNEKLTLLMQPGFVPGNEESVYALKVLVETQNYDQVLRRYESYIKSGTLKASPYRLPKLDSVLGTRFDGEISPGIRGATVILPLRDKTMSISVESEDFVRDFNDIILPSYVYNP